MFSTKFKKVFCNFADEYFFEKSKMAANARWQTCCQTTVAKATVLN